MYWKAFISFPYYLYTIKTYDNYKNPISKENLYYTSKFFLNNWNWKDINKYNQEMYFTNTMGYYLKIASNGQIINAVMKSNPNEVIGTLCINYNGINEILCKRTRQILINQFPSRIYPLISNLLIRKDYRNRKIGSSLIRKAMRELKHLDTMYIYVLVDKSDPSIKMFYYKLGFNLIEVENNYTNVDCLVKNL